MFIILNMFMILNMFIILNFLNYSFWVFLMWDPKREPLDQCTTAEKFAKYANGGSLSMCQIESVAFGINQCHHSDGIVPAQRV